LEVFFVVPREEKNWILLQKTVEIANEMGVKRIRWQVLGMRCLKFYRKQKAILDPEWINARLFFD
jgi:hypothetical protein